MRRDLFDAVFAFPVGRLFLLNLADSMELLLIDRAGYRAFLTELENVADRGVEGWWQVPLMGSALASSAAPVHGGERFSSVAALRLTDVRRIDAIRELAGDDPDVREVVEDAVLRTFLLSRLQKKDYWLTDRRSLKSAGTADEVRDRLGLDWVNDEMFLYRIDLRVDRVAAAGPKRPSALCRGTARFRARRHDEVRPRHFRGWGRTVELSAWCGRRAAAKMVGAAEVISPVGPLMPDDGEMHYVGRTHHPSYCTEDADHADFAVLLNGGSAPDTDAMYRRLCELGGTLT